MSHGIFELPGVALDVDPGDVVGDVGGLCGGRGWRRLDAGHERVVVVAGADIGELADGDDEVGERVTGDGRR
ncbi:MAG: hypothetical protein K8M05_06770, partial [Deltaproteobacteria bacterium]|nr:hypothetical protein [Kofleriaceae bacterium]